MYKEPLMLEKYEALQELYLKDPVRPLQVRSTSFVLYWIGLDWIGLDWIGLDWIGLDWIGLD